LVFSCPPIVFIQPKASSIRLRMRWLTAYPACRVVRPSIADERPLGRCHVAVQRVRSVGT
jgi:hypothetical protein